MVCYTPVSYTHLDVYKRQMVPPGGAGIGMHVIPVEKAIETENQSVDVEHISCLLYTSRCV